MNRLVRRKWMIRFNKTVKCSRRSYWDLNYVDVPPHTGEVRIKNVVGPYYVHAFFLNPVGNF